MVNLEERKKLRYYLSSGRQQKKQPNYRLRLLKKVAQTENQTDHLEDQDITNEEVISAVTVVTAGRVSTYVPHRIPH
jgi:hypothetical protein